MVHCCDSYGRHEDKLETRRQAARNRDGSSIHLGAAASALQRLPSERIPRAFRVVAWSTLLYRTIDRRILCERRRVARSAHYVSATSSPLVRRRVDTARRDRRRPPLRLD